MSKFLRMTSLVATVAAVAVATPAVAAPVNAQTDANAQVEILKGLTLDSAQDLDLGTVVLSGAGAWSATVEIDRDGNFDCDGGSGNVTCSGTPQEARYDVTGSAGYDVDIDSVNVDLRNANSDSLILTPDHEDIVTLDVNGANNFGVGGSVTVTNTTPDGVYTGTFAVTAEYQ
jgi:Mat/Ecp fimbriae major subunit